MYDINLTNIAAILDGFRDDDGNLPRYIFKFVNNADVDGDGDQDWGWYRFERVDDKPYHYVAELEVGYIGFDFEHYTNDDIIIFDDDSVNTIFRSGVDGGSYIVTGVNRADIYGVSNSKVIFTPELEVSSVTRVDDNGYDDDNGQNITIRDASSNSRLYVYDTDGVTFQFGADGTAMTAAEFAAAYPNGFGPVRDQGSDHAITVVDGNEITLTSDDLSYGDRDNSTITYEVTAVPQDGRLLRDGAVLGVGDSFTQTDINDGLISYQYDGGDIDDPSDLATFTISDEAGSSLTDVRLVIGFGLAKSSSILAETAAAGTSLASFDGFDEAVHDLADFTVTLTGGDGGDNTPFGFTVIDGALHLTLKEGQGAVLNQDVGNPVNHYDLTITYDDGDGVIRHFSHQVSVEDVYDIDLSSPGITPILDGLRDDEGNLPRYIFKYVNDVDLDGGGDLERGWYRFERVDDAPYHYVAEGKIEDEHITNDNIIIYDDDTLDIINNYPSRYVFGSIVPGSYIVTGINTNSIRVNNNSEAPTRVIFAPELWVRSVTVNNAGFIIITDDSTEEYLAVRKTGAITFQIGADGAPLTEDQFVAAYPNGFGLVRDQGSDHTITVVDGNEITLTSDDLSYGDRENSTITYEVTAAPQDGRLLRDGVVLGVGDNFTQADINDGLISYQHDVLNFFEPDNVATFTISDDVSSLTGVTLAIEVTGGASVITEVAAAGTSLASFAGFDATLYDLADFTVTLTGGDGGDNTPFRFAVIDGALHLTLKEGQGQILDQDVENPVNHYDLTITYDDGDGDIRTYSHQVTVRDAYDIDLSYIAPILDSLRDDDGNLPRYIFKYVRNVDGIDTNGDGVFNYLDNGWYRFERVADNPKINADTPYHYVAGGVRINSIYIAENLTDDDIVIYDSDTLYIIDNPVDGVSYIVTGTIVTAATNSGIVLGNNNKVIFTPELETISVTIEPHISDGDIAIRYASSSGSFFLFDPDGVTVQIGADGTPLTAAEFVAAYPNGFGPVRDQGSDHTITVLDGYAATLTSDDLSYGDRDNSTITYEVTAAPQDGSLLRDGVVLGVGDNFTQADINDGLISYQHDVLTFTDYQGSATFTISDDVSSLTGITLAIDFPGFADSSVITEVAAAGTSLASFAGFEAGLYDLADFSVTLTGGDGGDNTPFGFTVIDGALHLTLKEGQGGVLDQDVENPVDNYDLTITYDDGDGVIRTLSHHVSIRDVYDIDLSTLGIASILDSLRDDDGNLPRYIFKHVNNVDVDGDGTVDQGVYRFESVEDAPYHYAAEVAVSDNLLTGDDVFIVDSVQNTAFDGLGGDDTYIITNFVDHASVYGDVGNDRVIFSPYLYVNFVSVQSHGTWFRMLGNLRQDALDRDGKTEQDIFDEYPYDSNNQPHDYYTDYLRFPSSQFYTFQLGADGPVMTALEFAAAYHRGFGPVGDEGSDHIITVVDGYAVTLTSDDLSYGDRDNSTITYEVTTAPQDGRLLRDGAVLGVGETFTQADINDGIISYQHDVLNFFEPDNVATFTISDEAGSSLTDVTLAIEVTGGASVITEVAAAGASLASFAGFDATLYDLADFSVTLTGSDGGDNTPFRFAVIDGALHLTLKEGQGQILDQDVGNPVDSYNLTISYDNGDGDIRTYSHHVSITNINDEVPFFTNGPIFRAVEGTDYAIGETIFTASAATPDTASTGITYSLAAGNDLFSINALTGAVSFNVATVLDLEAAASYDLTVIATSTDGSNSRFNLQNVTLEVAAITEVALSFTSPATSEVLVEGIEYVSGLALYKAEAFSSDLLVNGAIIYSLSAGGDQFSIDADTGEVRFNSATTPDFEAQETYSFTVTATSSNAFGAEVTASQTVTLPVKNINDGPVTFTSDETATAIVEGTEVLASAPIYTAVASSADAAATSIRYSLIDGRDDDGDLFTIDTDTGEVRFNSDTTPDFETQDAYSFIVTAISSDADGNEVTASQSVTLPVININDELPVFSSPAIADAIIEGTDIPAEQILYTASADTPDMATTGDIVYALASATGLFSIDANTGEVRFKVATTPDFETREFYSFIVTATTTDGTNEVMAFQTVTLPVININDEAPNITSGETADAIVEGSEVLADQALYIATAATQDGAATGVFTFGLAAGVDDSDLFTIDADTGEVRFKANTTPDFEAQQSYSFTVTATSTDGTNEVTASQNVTLPVTNINDEAPFFNNGPSFKVVDGADYAAGETILTVRASSPDAAATGISYAILAVGNNPFSIDANTGEVSFNAATTLDLGTRATYNFAVEATSTDGANEVKVSEFFTLQVAADTEVALSFTSPTRSNVLVEGLEYISGLALYTADAFSADVPVNGAISYSLSAGGDQFSIDADTGVVSFISDTTPDFETQESHSFTVTASFSDADGNEVTASQSVTLPVKNINDEAVIFTSAVTADAIVEGVEVLDSDVIYAATVDTDTAATNISFSLTSGGDVFAINENGEVSFNSNTTPDFETQNSYSFTVTAISSDVDGNEVMASQTITLPVNNSNDAPIVVNGELSLDAGFVGTVVLDARHLSVTDVDQADPSLMTYSLPSTLPDGLTISVDGTALEAGNGANSSFTQADINAGRVSMSFTSDFTSGALSFTYADGIFEDTHTINFDITVRSETDEADNSNADGPLSIIGTDGRDIITDSKGNDTISSLAGDDDIILNVPDSNGNFEDIDEVDYHVAIVSDGVAGIDGSDIISGFRRTIDEFHLNAEIKDHRHRDYDTVLSHIEGDDETHADNLILITPNIEYDFGTLGSLNTEVDDILSVAGLYLQFTAGSAYSLGRVSMPFMQIQFDEAMTWSDFTSIVGADYDGGSGAVTDFAKLEALLGHVSYEGYFAATLSDEDDNGTFDGFTAADFGVTSEDVGITLTGVTGIDDDDTLSLDGTAITFGTASATLTQAEIAMLQFQDGDANETSDLTLHYTIDGVADTDFTIQVDIT